MSIRVTSVEARERIVAAAERRLRERPYRELGVDTLMAEAGLSRTIFYRHFDGLASVVLSLLAEIEADLAEALAAASPTHLRDVLNAAIIAYARHGAFLRAIDHAAGHDPAIEVAYRAMQDRFTETMAGQLEAAMDAGRVARGDPHELARALNLMNQHYLLETVGRDPGFNRFLALDTLLAVWLPLSSAS